MSKKRVGNKFRWLVIISTIVVLAFCFKLLINHKIDEQLFLAPEKEWESPKKVEDYFVEKMMMTPDEARAIRGRKDNDGTVDLRINSNVTLEALTSNLAYYGFVRDEEALKYALTHTVDKLEGNNGALGLSNGATIDINAEYRISEYMSAWEISDILLNKPSGYFSYDEYGYFFMP